MCRVVFSHSIPRLYSLTQYLSFFIYSKNTTLTINKTGEQLSSFWMLNELPSLIKIIRSYKGFHNLETFIQCSGVKTERQTESTPSYPRVSLLPHVRDCQSEWGKTNLSPVGAHKMNVFI